MPIVVGAAVVTAAAGTFAVVRAVATDEPVAVPPPVTTLPVTTLPATTTARPPASDAPSDEVVIEISGFEFSPAEVTVAPGTTVTWVNRDGADHSILSEDGSVLSPPMGDGDSFSFTFTLEAVYFYICGFHPEMTGTVVVEA